MESRRTFTPGSIAAVAALALVALLVAGAVQPPAAATHQPADKVAVAASALEVMSASVTTGEDSSVHTLATGTLRTSGPADLVLQLTAECALWTDVTTVGNDDSGAVAAVVVWVELDGAPVPVAQDDVDEPGRVVLCNRAYKRVTTEFDDDDATIESFMRTRSANAFNWITLNVGPGVHEVAVKAQLDVLVEGTGAAKAAVGKRTLVVEPVKLANDASV